MPLAHHGSSSHMAAVCPYDYSFTREDTNDEPLSDTNSYQYGPICVAGEYRSSGLFERLFEYSKHQMSTRYPYMVTFINKRNPRSFAAHDKKTSLSVISEFEFNGQSFYELASSTKNNFLLDV